MSVKYGSTDVKDGKEKVISENGVGNDPEIHIRYIYLI